MSRGIVAIRWPSDVRIGSKRRSAIGRPWADPLAKPVRSIGNSWSVRWRNAILATKAGSGFKCIALRSPNIFGIAKEYARRKTRLRYLTDAEDIACLKRAPNLRNRPQPS